MGIFNENRLLIGHQLTTGPQFHIVKGQEALEKYFQNQKEIEINELTVEGANPLENIEGSTLTEGELQFIVKGKIVGTEKNAEEIVPVFHADSWRPVAFLPYFYYGKSKIFLFTWLIFASLLLLEIIYIVFKLIYRTIIRR